MLLRVVAVCPGTGWVPGQTVDASPDEANRWADGVHAVVVRDEQMERAVSDDHR
jgi:hypothetical protein